MTLWWPLLFSEARLDLAKRVYAANLSDDRAIESRLREGENNSFDASKALL
jgi:hypothetical protein